MCIGGLAWSKVQVGGTPSVRENSERQIVNLDWASVVAADSNVVEGWSIKAETAVGREYRLKENLGEGESGAAAAARIIQEVFSALARGEATIDLSLESARQRRWVD